MFRNLPEKHNSRWRDHLNKVVHTYKCTKNDSTGYAPFFLLFARPLPLPMDLMFYHKPPTELPPLMPGDRVFVPSLSEWGRPGKLRSSWENQVHVVMEQKGNGMPVFEVRPESGTKQSRVLLLQRFSNSPSVYLATPHIPCVHTCKDLLGVQL